MSDVSDNLIVNKNGAMFFLVTFVIFLILHFFGMIWRRAWFMFWLIIGCILEVVGYSQLHYTSSSQSPCIIFAPIFLVVSVYISFSKALKEFDVTHLCPLNTLFLSVIFSVGDTICLGVQVAGIVMQFMDGKEKIGKVMVVISFVLQILLFVFFISIVTLVRLRISKRGFRVEKIATYKWPSFFILLYFISILFFIRNIFRLVEYGQGFGYIFNHVIFTCVFDGAPMLLIVIILLWFHPSFWFGEINVRQKEKKTDENTAEEYIDELPIKSA